MSGLASARRKCTGEANRSSLAIKQLQIYEILSAQDFLTDEEKDRDVRAFQSA
jgi:hypothetical protein